MTRRLSGDDPAFGSDSFLDIIANIVGILIILIVVAGVKVARQPPESASAASTAVRAESPSPSPASLPQRPTESPTTDGPERIAAVQQLLNHIQEQQIAARTDFERRQAELADVETEIAALQQEAHTLQNRHRALQTEAARRQHQADAAQQTIRETKADLTALRTAEQHVQQRLDDAARERTRLKTALAQAARQQRRAHAQLQTIRQQTAQLQELLEQPSFEEDSKTRLEHRLSPVARSGSRHELHFRIHDGLVAWIPLEPLLQRLKSQVMNRMDLIRRFGRYEGTCGPAGGFLMRYTVRRAAPSPSEMLSGMSSGYRIEVARWTIVPAETYSGESVARALKSGSRFRQIVESADPETTVTFWLYGSDFEAFRRLREYVHRLDLRVAGRPLPPGTNISGSPAGSRSSAQ